MKEERLPKDMLHWSPYGRRRGGKPTYKWIAHTKSIMGDLGLEVRDRGTILLWKVKNGNPGKEEEEEEELDSRRSRLGLKRSFEKMTANYLIPCTNN
jgi:hypothetical protein